MNMFDVIKLSRKIIGLKTSLGEILKLSNEPFNSTECNPIK